MAFDVITPAKIGQGTIVSSPSTTTLYTVPVLTKAIVKTIDISNYSSSPKTVNLYLVPDGGSYGNSNILIPNVYIPANGIFQWSGAQVLSSGDTIQANASNSGITITISGGEAV